MTAQQLKNSILNLAISGKLVPQDPHDEPTSKLVEQIRKEKDKLIKDKKIKPSKFDSVIFKGEDNLHYEKIGKETRCIEDEIPFEIPNSWVWVRLGSVGLYKKGPFGSSLTKNIFIPKNNTSIKVYEQKNAIYKNHRLGDYYISREYFEKKLKNFLVEPNDIIVSCAGTIGETYILPNDIELGIINQALMKMTIFAPINKEYFLLYFNYIIKANSIQSSKGSAIKNIPPFEIFKKFILPLPPLSEQKRIVDKLEEILPLVEKYKEDKEKLDELNLNFPSKLKKSILDYAIKGKLVEQNLEDESVEILLQKIREEKQRLVKDKKLKADKFPQSTIFIGEDNSPYEKIGKETRCIEDEIPFEIPSSWAWVRLGSMGVAQTGSTPSTQVRDFYGDYMPFIKPADITNSGIDYNNEKLSKKGTEVGRVAEKGSILMVCIGGSLGKCYFNDRIVSFNQQINSLTPFFSSYKFIFYYLLSSHFFEQLQDRATGTATPIVNKTSWESILIPLPPLPEQKRIVTKIEELLKFVDILQSSLK